jgi:hypothetical protein
MPKAAIDEHSDSRFGPVEVRLPEKWALSSPSGQPCLTQTLCHFDFGGAVAE